jgi:hypothetical protein
MPKQRPIHELVRYVDRIEALIKECDNKKYGRNQEDLKKRDKALILAVFLTGGYLTRILKLKKNDFVFNDKTRKPTEAFYIKNMSVARHRKDTVRDVIIYTDDPFADLLKDWVMKISDDAYLFPSPQKDGGKVQPLDRKMASRIIVEVSKRALDSPLTSMDLRSLRMIYLTQKKGFNKFEIRNIFGMVSFPKIFQDENVPIGTINYAFRKMKINARHFKLMNNWFSITCALQLQEVIITLVAKNLGIKLDKKKVYSVLGKPEPKKDYVPFGDKYDAFSKIIKEKYGVIMPTLVKQYRRSFRSDVLHGGKTPEPEEISSIIVFTNGLLEKLTTIQ